MTHQGQSPGGSLQRYLLRTLKRLMWLALFVAVSLAVLFGLWIVLNPRI